ncbi:MAG: ribosome small subunit-dependent GTPase A [Bdellovibrionota bacterium]|nr:ribosome small subunit-dependent GTPase A [Bdellovibrionota bacterium]
MIKARVYHSSKREFTCKILETGEMIEATSLGKLLKKDESIVVGDYVSLKKVENNFEIHEVEKRKNELYRVIVRERKKKVTAANCDYIVIMNSVSRPRYKRGILDRFLIRAQQWDVVPLVVFNKMDQYDPKECDIIFEKDRLNKLEVDFFEVSAKFPEYEKKYLDSGLDELKSRLKGSTSIFVGQSGVGKSRSISTFSDGVVELKTKSVGKKGKGSHTTTWSEIIDCPNFSLIDSPGIRSFSMEDLLEESLIDYFPDLHSYSIQCRFNDCSHGKGSNGCFFQSLDENKYEDKLVLSRLESFLRIREEISKVPFWDKKM